MHDYDSIYSDIFSDNLLMQEIRNKLPGLFLLAEIENSRNGKLGMEIGSARERILIALLMYKFGKNNVNTEIPIIEPEIDVITHNQPLSIKTFSSQNNRMSGVKLIWSVDQDKAIYFQNSYTPSCDMLLAQIQWGQTGHLYLFSKQAQIDVLNKLGREKYIKLPKQGTNSRGVEITKEALTELSNHSMTKRIDIDFNRSDVDYSQAYSRWLELWESN